MPHHLPRGIENSTVFDSGGDAAQLSKHGGLALQMFNTSPQEIVMRHEYDYAKSQLQSLDTPPSKKHKILYRAILVNDQRSCEYLHHLRIIIMGIKKLARSSIGSRFNHGFAIIFLSVLANCLVFFRLNNM